MFSLIPSQDKSPVFVGSSILSVREIVQLSASHTDNVKINGKKHKRHNEQCFKGFLCQSKSIDFDKINVH